MLKNKIFYFSISLLCGLITASQQQFRHVYDENSKILWMLGKANFSELNIDEPEINVVFCGEFSSGVGSVDVKNLLIFGSLTCSTPGTMHLTARENFYTSGARIIGLNIEAKQNAYVGFSDEVISQIRALGIDITRDDIDSASFKVSTPK